MLNVINPQNHCQYKKQKKKKKTKDQNQKHTKKQKKKALGRKISQGRNR